MAKIMLRASATIMGIFLLLSVGGVFAVWIYPNGVSDPQDTPISISMSVFDYTPEEVLPGGDENDEEIVAGENHFSLIDRILNEKEKSYGLNINDNSVLHDYLHTYGVVYSNQKVSGGNLKFVLDASNNTYGLYYCLEKISDTEYHCYTFSTDALSTASGAGLEILAFNTILLKTDIWRATTSYSGYAIVRPLTSLSVSADPQSIPYSIDMSTWHTD